MTKNKNISQNMSQFGRTYQRTVNSYLKKKQFIIYFAIQIFQRINDVCQTYG